MVDFLLNEIIFLPMVNHLFIELKKWGYNGIYIYILEWKINWMNEKDLIASRKKETFYQHW